MATVPRRSLSLRTCGALTGAMLAACAFCTSAAGDDASAAASSYLAEALRDPSMAEATLLALRTTGDAELAGVFAAMSRSGGKERRMLATIALRDFAADPQAARALLERLQGDPAMAIRAEALIALIAMKAITDQQLIDALKISDEAVQCVAARELVKCLRSQAAAETLSKLVGSNDPGTAAMARLSLLAAGDNTQLGPLEEVITKADTTNDVLAVLLEQIAEDKISAAAGLAERAAASRRPVRPLRVHLIAYRALAATSSRAPTILQEDISKTRTTSLSVPLLSILGEHDGAERQLRALGQGDGAVAVLARFELARRSGGPDAADAAKAVIAMEHPIVIEYLLERASGDIASRGAKAAFYAPALLQCIRSVKASPTMGIEHRRAAMAATLLADLGSPEAMAGLKAMLAERFSSTVRAAAAGLLRTKNRAACELASPLLKSPYQELVTDAALTLGRFGDSAAAEQLGAIVLEPKRHSPVIVTLASWYLLKVSGQARRAAGQLAASLK